MDFLVIEWFKNGQGASQIVSIDMELCRKRCRKVPVYDQIIGVVKKYILPQGSWLAKITLYEGEDLVSTTLYENEFIWKQCAESDAV